MLTFNDFYSKPDKYFSLRTLTRILRIKRITPKRWEEANLIKVDKTKKDRRYKGKWITDYIEKQNKKLIKASQ